MRVRLNPSTAPVAERDARQPVVAHGPRVVAVVIVEDEEASIGIEPDLLAPDPQRAVERHHRLVRVERRGVVERMDDDQVAGVVGSARADAVQLQRRLPAVSGMGGIDQQTTVGQVVGDRDAEAAGSTVGPGARQAPSDGQRRRRDLPLPTRDRAVLLVHSEHLQQPDGLGVVDRAEDEPLVVAQLERLPLLESHRPPKASDARLGAGFGGVHLRDRAVVRAELIATIADQGRRRTGAGRREGRSHGGDRTGGGDRAFGVSTSLGTTRAYRRHRASGRRDPMNDQAPIVLTAATTSATILPALGARIADLDLGDGPVLRTSADADGWKDWGCYPLLPWSNRVPGGRLHLDGVTFQVPVNHDDGSAIHGLVADCPWHVSTASEYSAHLTVDIDVEPFRMQGEITYALEPGSLRIDLAVRNVEPSAAVPVGLGIHPWFRSGPIRVPAAMKWPGDPLPTGAPVLVDVDDDLRALRLPPTLDRCFTGLDGDTADVPGARLRWSEPIRHVVVFTGHDGWVAVEPVTMANDGFGLAQRGQPGHSVHLLAPGQRFSSIFWLMLD